MATANTPGAGQPISLDDIRIVFGQGNNLNTGDDLDDFHGIYYYDTFYPYAKGKFSSAGSPLTLNDFHDKSATDPAQPGFFYDDVPGVNKTYTLPAFRNNIQIAMWGAGGGGGAGKKNNNGNRGSNTIVTGTFSNGTNFTITAAGGLGGQSTASNGPAGSGGTPTVTPSFTSPNFTGTLTNGNNGSVGASATSSFRSGAGASAPSVTVTSPYGAIVTYTGGTGGAAMPAYAGLIPLAAGSTLNIDGNSGGKPGAGGSGGSWWYNKMGIGTNQSAGGGAGSGGTTYSNITRLAITPGSILTYTVGTGGAGGTKTGFVSSGTEYNVGIGGNGGNGAILIIWS